MINWRMIGAVIAIGLFLLFPFFRFDPKVSLHEEICNQIIELDESCEKIYNVDTESNLIFYKNGSFIKVARTEKDSLKVIEVFGMNPLEMQEKEGFQWGGNEHPDYSILWGTHTDEIGLIKIKSEKNIQPNRIKIEDNTWLWYSFFEHKELNPPEQFSVYDHNGEIISSIK